VKIGNSLRKAIAVEGELSTDRRQVVELRYCVFGESFTQVMRQPFDPDLIAAVVGALLVAGARPAISVGISVSRVGSAAQLKAMKQVAGQLKGDLAQFRELAAFAQFGSELDAKTQAQIDRGKRIMEVFKQPQYSPIPVEVQVAVIWAVQNGYVDNVPVDRVKEYQAGLTEFLTTRKSELLGKIAQEKALSPALTADLKAAADQFKETWR
jgi:F-type H+/Na+-transporting ATPase subunit alpha